MSEGYKAKRSDTELTGEWRWAYPYVHRQSDKRPNGKPRKSPVWIITGMAPKLNADPAQCPNYQLLQRICMQAVQREPAWGGTFPAGGHWPIQDGDVPYKPKAPTPGQPMTAPDPNAGAWRRGYWIFEASTSLQPGPKVCVMRNGVAEEIPAETINGKQMYKSGDWGFGSIHSYTFWNEKFGVNFGFEGILWTKEGEQIGASGAKSAQSMFGSVATVAPAGAAPGPAMSTAPQQYAPPAAPAAPAAPVAPQYAAAPNYPAPPMPPGVPMPPR